MPDIDLLRDLIGALRIDLTSRLDTQDSTLRRIETQVRSTNGRVTELEHKNLAVEAVRLDGVERQERKVRREDYRRGPRVQNLLTGVVALIALAALVVPLVH